MANRPINGGRLGQRSSPAPIPTRPVAIAEAVPEPVRRHIGLVLEGLHNQAERLEAILHNLAELTDRVGAPQIPADATMSQDRDPPPPSHFTDLEQRVARIENNIGGIAYHLERLKSVF